jgi:hypothetical protein
MKKFLLSAMALVAAMSVNAQEFCAFNAEENADFAATGITTDKIAVVGGTIIGKTESVTAKIGADDEYKSSSIGTITLGDASINGGLQGNNNPKDADGLVPSESLVAPAGGAYYVFDVAKDGYLYVLQNSSSNKAYTVFEEGEAIGYTFSAYWKNGTLPTGKGVYSYELKGAGEFNQLKEAGISKVLWPEEYIIGETYNKEETVNAKGETGKGYGDGGLGVIKFPVFAGCQYIVNANGSKMTASGFYFDEKGDANVSIKVDDADVILLNAGQIPDAEPTPVYSVIGTINGNWDTDTDMTKGSDGVYTAVFNEIKAGEYKFKVRKDHDWTINWGNGDDADGNTVFQVEKDGSTVTITFDPATEKLEYKVTAPDAINSVKAAKKFEGAIFNIAGQKVNASYKGLVIKNGKKYIQK